MHVRAIAIIPVRYASTRLPGKALALLDGRPMIRHVAERTCQARSLAHVIVATDDERIAHAVAGSGADVAMTRADHATGTDRLAEVAEQMDADVVVNVQGDLPLLDPAMVDAVIGRMERDRALPMATLAAPIHDDAEWRSPHVVKVVCDTAQRALYFSRSPVPYHRDEGAPTGVLGWRHIGMYAYRRDVLLRLAALAPTPLESSERLEQLRALEHGIAIGVEAWTAAEPVIEVDVAEDLERARAALSGRVA